MIYEVTLYKVNKYIHDELTVAMIIVCFLEIILFVC